MAVADLLPSRYYALVGRDRRHCARKHGGLVRLTLAVSCRRRRHVEPRRRPRLFPDPPRDLAQLSAARAFSASFSRRFARRFANICSRATTRRYRSRARNARSSISAPRTSRAGNRSAPAKMSTWPAMNGSIIHCVRCRSMILIFASKSAAGTAKSRTPAPCSTFRQ